MNNQITLDIIHREQERACNLIKEYCLDEWGDFTQDSYENIGLAFSEIDAGDQENIQVQISADLIDPAITFDYITEGKMHVLHFHFIGDLANWLENNLDFDWLLEWAIDIYEKEFEK